MPSRRASWIAEAVSRYGASVVHEDPVSTGSVRWLNAPTSRPRTRSFSSLHRPGGRQCALVPSSRSARAINRKHGNRSTTLICPAEVMLTTTRAPDAAHQASPRPSSTDTGVNTSAAAGVVGRVQVGRLRQACGVVEKPPLRWVTCSCHELAKVVIGDADREPGIAAGTAFTVAAASILPSWSPQDRAAPAAGVAGRSPFVAAHHDPHRS
jgi:hypothetical protein